MALMEWSAGYSVNIQEFDGQHKRLVNLINELHAAMLQAKGKEVLGKILNELTDYTVFHFASEEKAMKQHGFPGYEKHKAEHEKLTGQVAAFTKDYNDGKNVISQEILSFLKKWLVDHIVGADKKYTSFLNEKGVK